MGNVCEPLQKESHHAAHCSEAHMFVENLIIYYVTQFHVCLVINHLKVRKKFHFQILQV